MFHVEHFGSAALKIDALPFVLVERMFHVEHFSPAPVPITHNPSPCLPST
jgi:hypothetical protein